MAVTVRWHDRKSGIILYEYSRDWEWSDVPVAIAQENELHAAAPELRNTAVIVYFPDNVVLPKNLFQNLQGEAGDRHPSTRIVVIVTQAKFISALVALFKRFKSGIAYAPDLKRAEVLIQEAYQRHEEQRNNKR